MNWEVFGGHEMYVRDNGRIEGRVFKHSKGFGASLTPVNYGNDEEVKRSFLGYYISVEAAKAAIERAYENSAARAD